MKTLTCKVVIVGECGVGKTSIISKFLDTNFNSSPDSTKGANYASKELIYKEYNTKLKFDIWDTAGQENFRSLASIFYRDASIAILVYDITNKQSFDEIKKYWYNQIKENTLPKSSKI